MEYCNGGSVV